MSAGTEALIVRLARERDEARTRLAEAERERDEWQMQSMSLESQLPSEAERKAEANYRAGLEAELAKAREEIKRLKSQKS